MDELLEKWRDIDQRIEELKSKDYHATFSVSKDWYIFPKILPLNGDSIKLSSFLSLKTEVIVLEDWSLTAPIYFLSVVTFWEKNKGYTFQVVPSTKSGCGVLSLVKTFEPVKLPGHANQRLRAKKVC